MRFLYWQLLPGLRWRPPRRSASRRRSTSPLIEDAQRDRSALGMERLLITPLSRFRQGTPIRLAEGILFTTYATLRTDFDVLVKPAPVARQVLDDAHHARR
jgi:hypothetical protein